MYFNELHSKSFEGAERGEGKVTHVAHNREVDLKDIWMDQVQVKAGGVEDAVLVLDNIEQTPVGLGSGEQGGTGFMDPSTNPAVPRRPTSPDEVHTQRIFLRQYIRLFA